MNETEQATLNIFRSALEPLAKRIRAVVRRTQVKALAYSEGYRLIGECVQKMRQPPRQGPRGPAVIRKSLGGIPLASREEVIWGPRA
jgi:hypothetical protein